LNDGASRDVVQQGPCESPAHTSGQPPWEGQTGPALWPRRRKGEFSLQIKANSTCVNRR
jgi:hypothetical protein